MKLDIWFNKAFWNPESCNNMCKQTLHVSAMFLFQTHTKDQSWNLVIKNTNSKDQRTKLSQYYQHPQGDGHHIKALML